MIAVERPGVKVKIGVQDYLWSVIGQIKGFIWMFECYVACRLAIPSLVFFVYGSNCADWRIASFFWQARRESSRGFCLEMSGCDSCVVQQSVRG
jgi:hypothetical protein